jgi:glycosyltransferase involved in cell wall biosynthesis
VSPPAAVRSSRPKLCYVIPTADRKVATHHLHLIELIERVVDELDIYLIAGGDADAPELEGITHFKRVHGSFPRRLVAHCLAITRAMRMGYRAVYVHYQVYPALFALGMSKAGVGQVLFWSCVERNAHLVNGQPAWPARVARNVLIDRPMATVIHSSDMLVTCSVVKARHYAEEFGRPLETIRVLPLWVNLERFHPEPAASGAVRERLGIPREAPVVLFVHTIGAHRGADWLPDLARNVVERSPNAVFVVAGEGPLSEALRHDVRRSGLEAHFRLLGAVPNHQVPELYGIADVFINPSPTEAFGRVLLESMACGVPFVSTDGGSGGTLAFTTAAQQEYIVASEDRGEFTRKLIALLASPERRAFLREEGLTHVRDFSLDRAAERFVALVREAASGGKDPVPDVT